MRRIFDLFARKRNLFFALMLTITIASGFLATRLRPNTDMTAYLPSDSRMKVGLDSLRANFPTLDTDILMIEVMFSDSTGTPEKADSILAMGGLDGLLSTSHNGDRTLYQFALADDAAPKKVVSAIRERYAGQAIVETNANKIMPENIGVILISGSAIVMAILFVMCSSILEALLFLVAIAMAILINVGTNIFLPNVSILTTTIAPVLQLVLSMDYSIILMSRFRQERMKKKGEDVASTMSRALFAASRSIFSSSFTTVVGLLALVFMRFRIGMDLGLVLAKGVLCSLVSIYTVLPFLIVKFNAQIEKTTKKVPLIPTDRLARFEMKFRVPVAVVFFGLFLAMFYLQRGTELNYASIWESEITKHFPAKNPVIVLYRTSEEEKMTRIIENLADDPHVSSALSYPSAMLSRHTVREMPTHIRSLMSLAPSGQLPQIDTSLLSEKTLKVLYYGYTHPERNERLGFEDLIGTLRAAGISTDLTAAPTDPGNFNFAINASKGAQGPSIQTDEEEGRINTTVFTYENSTAELTSDEMSALLGFSASQSATIYRLAGKKKRMTAPEFLHYVHEHILINPILSKFISKADAKELKRTMERADAAVAAGPAVSGQTVAATDTLSRNAGELAGILTIGQTDSTEKFTALPEPPAKTREETIEDEMLDFALSGEKLSARQLERKLKKAGIGIDRSQIELLYLFHGSLGFDADSTALSLDELLDYLCDDLSHNSAISGMVDSSSLEMLSNARTAISEGFSNLRSERYSAAVFVTDYALESPETFAFIQKILDSLDSGIDGQNYVIGESVMYKEMHDGFKKELVLLTIITIAAIFLIVALTFKSFIIPTVLVMTVMTGVFINVFVSGLGGRTMLYLAYLIVQSILMGATIDYAILFTNYYREHRRKADRAKAVAAAYKGSIHTIMTSGCIIILAPFVMSILMKDPTIVSILSSLTIGALGTIFLILFVLPSVICCLDRIIARK